MAKSATPLSICVLEGVNIGNNMTNKLTEKGHSLTYRDLMDYDIIIGPTCYNHNGPLEMKQFDIMTKSTRALVRAQLKEKRLLVKEEKTRMKLAKSYEKEIQGE